jgi:hypothetical protein
MASHTVDEFVFDEGFQLINPTYPELIVTGVLADFDLRCFEPSVRFLHGNAWTTIADPRRSHREAFSLLRSHDVSLADVARAARLFAHCCLGSPKTSLASVTPL